MGCGLLVLLATLSVAQAQFVSSLAGPPWVLPGAGALSAALAYRPHPRVHGSRPLADDDFKVGFADPQTAARRKADIDAYKGMLNSKPTIPVPDLLNLHNSPVWARIKGGAGSAPLMGMAMLYFVHNNIYDLSVLSGNPLRIRFPESSFDGTSVPDGVPFFSELAQKLADKAPDLQSVQPMTSSLYPLSSWDGSWLGGSGSSFPTTSSSAPGSL